MAHRNFYAHRSPEGRGPSDRARAAGYGRGAAENLHVKVTSAERVVADWMKSKGHCKNFMNPRYRDVGIGHAWQHGSRYGNYWTANLGRGAR